MRPLHAVVGTLCLSPFLQQGLAGQVSSAPGQRLYGAMTGTDVYLVDDLGKVTHTWKTRTLPGHGMYLLEDGSLLRAINSISKGNGSGGAVQRLSWTGQVLWEFHYDTGGVLSHHDIAPLPNGNVILMAWEDLTPAQAVAHGRDPNLILNGLFQPDHLIEVQPTGPTTGNIVWEWHIVDHVIQDRNAQLANYGNVGNHPELIDINYPPVASTDLDWNHMNGIDYEVEHDWIVVSVHHQNEVWIIDHGTTTQEAKSHSGGRWGKGGDLLFRWGNPAAHRAGTPADQQLFGQHDPRFVRRGRPGAGHLTVFNNNYRPGRSAVFEIELPLDARDNFVRSGPRFGPDGPTWMYVDTGIFSPIISGAERLPNGNTLICSGVQGKMFEVTPDGKVAWSHKHDGWVFQAHYVESTLWATTPNISRATGGTLDFVIANSTRHVGEPFMLLGSASGTRSGITIDDVYVPLRPDTLMVMLLWNATSGSLGNTAGLLNGDGFGTASLTLGPASVNPILLGRSLDFACTFADKSTMRLDRVSNVVNVPILP